MEVRKMVNNASPKIIMVSMNMLRFVFGILKTIVTETFREMGGGR